MTKKTTPILISFSGKSGSGKSTISRLVASHFQATYLNMDTIEWLLSEDIQVSVNRYEVSYGLAKENLAIGNNVVSDAVNHSIATRKGWDQVSQETNCTYINVEVICSDDTKRRNRLEERKRIMNLPPSWNVDDIMLEPWDNWDEQSNYISFDTADKCVDECVEIVVSAVSRLQQ